MSQNQEESIELTLSPTKPVVNLSQWLEKEFQPGWQSLSVLYDTNPDCLAAMLRRTFHFRSPNLVKRFKWIKLGKPQKERQLVLLVAIALRREAVGFAEPLAIASETKQKLRIHVQLQPMEEEKILSGRIKLSLLNKSGETLRLVKSSPQDDFIKLPPFCGLFKEHFSIKIELDSTNIIENFVI